LGMAAGRVLYHDISDREIADVALTRVEGAQYFAKRQHAGQLAAIENDERADVAAHHCAHRFGYRVFGTDAKDLAALHLHYVADDHEHTSRRARGNGCQTISADCCPLSCGRYTLAQLHAGGISDLI